MDTRLFFFFFFFFSFSLHYRVVVCFLFVCCSFFKFFVSMKNYIDRERKQKSPVTFILKKGGPCSHYACWFGNVLS